MELAQKITASPVHAPAAIPKFDTDPRAQPPVREIITQMKRLAPLPTSQQAFTHQPTVNFSPPAVPVEPLLIDVPMTQAAPVISLPIQPTVPMVPPTAPSSWFQQQVIIGFDSHFPAQPLAPPATIAPQLHLVQPTYGHAFADHQSASDEFMDITDGDGDSWMCSNELDRSTTLLEPAPQILVQTAVTPTESTPWGTCGDGPAQQPSVVIVYDPTPTTAPHAEVHAYKLPSGLHPRVSPLTPPANRKVIPRRRGVVSNPLSSRNKNLARTSALQKHSLLRKKAAVRSSHTEYLERPTPPQVHDHTEAVDPAPLVNSTAPVATADLPSPRRKRRSYFDRLYVNRVSPLSQRGPSEVSLMGCKAIPKSASLRKAFIWQRHFTARDRRAAGMDGRISVIYQDDPTTGQQVVAGSQREPALPQRKAPSDDHLPCPRRKRPSAADFIRAEDAEKEEEILGAAVDALQSMGLNSENPVLASLGFDSASDALEIGPTASLFSVAQDLEFHQDQAQLLLEDIFENFEKKQDGLTASFSSDSSSDSDSEFEDD